jgi:hypothetical protein
MMRKLMLKQVKRTPTIYTPEEIKTCRSTFDLNHWLLEGFSNKRIASYILWSSILWGCPQQGGTL